MDTKRGRRELANVGRSSSDVGDRRQRAARARTALRRAARAAQRDRRRRGREALDGLACVSRWTGNARGRNELFFIV